AVTWARRVSPTTLSLTGGSENETWSFPAAKTTLAGTVAAVGRSLTRLTVSTRPRLAFRVKLPFTSPDAAFSGIALVLRARVNTATSLLRIVSGALSGRNPAALAEMVSTETPPATRLSWILILKFAENCPAGMITLEGR